MNCRICALLSARVGSRSRAGMKILITLRQQLSPAQSALAGSVGDNARRRVAATHTAVFRLRKAGNAVSVEGRPKRYWMRYSS
jgi:hypothetical protein